MKNPEIDKNIRSVLNQSEIDEILINSENNSSLLNQVKEYQNSINQLLKGQNAKGDGQTILELKGIDPSVAKTITEALKNRNYSALKQFSFKETTISQITGNKSEALGLYYTNPGGDTPDINHKLGLNPARFDSDFKVVEVTVDGKQFYFDPVCGNFTEIITPETKNPQICLEASVCVEQLYDSNKIDLDTARTVQSINQSPKIFGDINDMAKGTIAQEQAIEMAQKGTLNYVREAVLEAPVNLAEREKYIIEKGLDKIHFGKDGVSLDDIIRGSQNNPAIKEFWEKVVAANKINAMEVKLEANGTFTLTIGLPKTNTQSSRSVADGGAGKVTTEINKLPNGAVETITKTVKPGDIVTDTISTQTNQQHSADATWDQTLQVLVQAGSYGQFINECNKAYLSNTSSGRYEERISGQMGADVKIKSGSTKVTETKGEGVVEIKKEVTPPKPLEPVPDENFVNQPTPGATPPGTIETPVTAPEIINPTAPTPGATPPPSDISAPQSPTVPNEVPTPTPGATPPVSPEAPIPIPIPQPAPTIPVEEVNVPRPTPASTAPSDSLIETGGPKANDFTAVKNTPKPVVNTVPSLSPAPRVESTPIPKVEPNPASIPTPVVKNIPAPELDLPIEESNIDFANPTNP